MGHVDQVSNTWYVHREYRVAVKSRREGGKKMKVGRPMEGREGGRPKEGRGEGGGKATYICPYIG